MVPSNNVEGFFVDPPADWILFYVLWRDKLVEELIYTTDNKEVMRLDALRSEKLLDDYIEWKGGEGIRRGRGSG